MRVLEEGTSVGGEWDTPARLDKSIASLALPVGLIEHPKGWIEGSQCNSLCIEVEMLNDVISPDRSR